MMMMKKGNAIEPLDGLGPRRLTSAPICTPGPTFARRMWNQPGLHRGSVVEVEPSPFDRARDKREEGDEEEDEGRRVDSLR